MEKLQINTEWEKLSKEGLKEYVDNLHDYILKFDASSIKRMIVSLDKVSAKIADDLDKITDGTAAVPALVEDEDGEVDLVLTPIVFLSDSKDSKVFDRVLALAGKVKDFKSVSDMADEIKPEIQKTEAEKLAAEAKSVDGTAKPTVLKGNVFETLQKDVVDKVRKGTNG